MQDGPRRDPPHREPPLADVLEACRPDRGDLEDPHFAPLADRLASDPELEERLRQMQHVDAVLGAAFHDVPVPDGLQERLLARLGRRRARRRGRRRCGARAATG